MNKKEIEAALKEENAVDLIRESFVAKDKEIKSLADDLDESKKQFEILSANSEEKNLMVESMEEEITSLTEKLEAAKADPDTLKRCSATFTVGGKTYQFKQGILKVHVSRRLNPEAPGMYPAEEIAKNKKLRETLVEINYGGIELVPSKSKS